MRIKKLKRLNKTEEKMCKLMSYYYNSMREIFYDRRGDRNREEEFVAIPFHSVIINILFKIIKTFPDHKSFLDIGCGKGNILHIARALNLRCEGIEFRTDYKDFLKVFPKIHYKKAQNFNFYNEFDIIYLYRPIKEDKPLSELLSIIIKNMKKGAILISPCCNFFASTEEQRILFHSLKQLDYDVYIKQ